MRIVLVLCAIWYTGASSVPPRAQPTERPIYETRSNTEYDQYVDLCNAGEADKCMALAHAHATGGKLVRGKVVEDQRQALAFYRSACRLDHSTGCGLAGEYLTQGRGGAPDHRAAAQYFRHGCDRDDARSCDGLATAYDKGLGVTQDDDRAQELFRKSCRLDTKYCLSKGLPGDGRLALDGLGTCFAISADGLLATNEHVVHGADALYIRFGEGEFVPAKVVKSSKITDLAVIKIEQPAPGYLVPVKTSAVHLGDKVFTVGFGASAVFGIEPKYTEGVVSATSVAKEDALLMLSMPVHPGNSGGPLVTEDGELVGVVRAVADPRAFVTVTGSLPDGISFAVKSDYLLSLLDTSETAPEKVERPEAIRRVENSVCLIVRMKRK